MANTYTRGRSGRILTIVFDGVSDWDSLDPSSGAYFPGGMKILWIQFKVAAGGKMIIRDGSVDSQAYILYAEDSTGDGTALNMRGLPVVYPCVKGTDVANGDILTIAYI